MAFENRDLVGSSTPGYSRGARIIVQTRTTNKLGVSSFLVRLGESASGVPYACVMFSGRRDGTSDGISAAEVFLRRACSFFTQWTGQTVWPCGEWCFNVDNLQSGRERRHRIERTDRYR